MSEFHHEIQAWLESEPRDFNAGYTLFLRFSRNRSIAHYIARKGDMNKLVYELEKILKLKVLKENKTHKTPAPRGHVLELAKTVKAQSSEQINKVSSNRFDYENAPPEHQKLYDEIRMHQRVITSNHEKMKLANSDAERKEFRQNIIHHEDRMKEKWAILDGKKEYPLPSSDKTSKAGSNDTPDIKDINAAKSYLSKYIGRLDETEGEDLEKWKQKLKERVQILQLGNIPLGKHEELLKKHGIIESNTMAQ